MAWGTWPWRAADPAGGGIGRVAAPIAALATTVLLVSASAPGAHAVVSECVLAPPDLLAWWPGDDTLAGAVGPDLTGSAVFAPAVAGTGIVHTASTTLGAQLPLLDSGVTVDAWIRPNETGLVQAVMSKWDFPSFDDGARTFTLLIDPLGRLIWSTDEITTRRPVDHVVDPGVDLFDGAFHHVAATWDRTSIAVFVDGVERGRIASQGSTLNPAPTTQFRLGSQVGTGSAFAFDGVIDEASIARRALTATEIAQLFAANGGGKCSIGLVPGAPAYVRGAGVRVKGANTGNEIFVGPMTSPSATPRSEVGYADFATVGAKVYQLSVGFDASSNVISASIAEPAASAAYDLDVDPGTGCASAGWDVLHIAVRDGRTDSAVALTNVALGGVALGDLGAIDVAGTPGSQEWGVFGAELGAGFTFTADMQVDGFNGNEAIKVEITAGCA